MDIGASAIVEVRVWFPYEIKHLDMNSHFLHGPHELESFVHPRLSEIGVHRVGLKLAKSHFLRCPSTECCTKRFRNIEDKDMEN